MPTSNTTFDKSTDARTVAAAYASSIKGSTILITGVNRAGVGFTTAQAFASQSPKLLILCGRSESKVQECIDTLKAEYVNVEIKMLLMDLSSQASVRASARTLLNWGDVEKLDIVVNNAGIMRHGVGGEGVHPMWNIDGVEDQFGTNVLGHWLFTNLVMEKILKAEKPRVINVSSSGTWVAPCRLSDVKYEKASNELPKEEQPSWGMMKMVGMQVDETVKYIPTCAYGSSKTGNILFSVALNERLHKEKGLLSLALNPGEIKTELGRNTPDEWLQEMIKKGEEAGRVHWKTQEQGASTSLVASCDPGLELPKEDGDGYFLSDCQVAKAPPYAVKRETADELWRVCEALVGEKFVY